MTTSSPLRVGQFSAYYGDRRDAMSELLRSNVDVLTGDYLAELTMLVLKKTQLRGGPGYAAGFVDQLRDNVAELHRSGVRLVTNAGGLDPLGCAEAVREVCREAGVDLTVAAIVGDDLSGRLDELQGAGERFTQLHGSEELSLGDHEVLTANAYLGAWPIVRALADGADIVICPRVTDASLVIGPAAWHFGWSETDYDALAGGLWAGHAIECGGQVTGGNFAFFYEHDDLGLPGMPIAEIFADGECVVTKADGTGGAVTVDTVKAQLLYEVTGARYDNPDVVGDLSSLTVTEEGADRVRISGARGYAPTPETKLSLCYEGGYRNSVTVGLTGAHVEEKLAWLRREVERAVGKPEEFDMFRMSVIGPAAIEGQGFEAATAWAVFTARDSDRSRVSRANFSDRITQLGVSNIPGFYTAAPPQRERLVGVQWPCLVAKEHVRAEVVTDSSRDHVEWPPDEGTPGQPTFPVQGTPEPERAPASTASAERTKVRLGRVFGTRSGDKGGMANLGVWARDPGAYAWLVDNLTEEELRARMPELADLRIERHVLPNLYAVNFLLHDYLELGVASCTRLDAQAKGVGEYLGAMTIELPQAIAGSGK